MAQHRLRGLRSEVTRLLGSRRYGKAISTVKEMLAESRLNDLIFEAEQISQTYRYMTDYLLQGVDDQGRGRMLADMAVKLHLLADLAVRSAESADSPDYYYSTLRFIRLRKESLPDLLREYGNVSSELSLAEAAGNDAAELRRQRRDLLVRMFDSLFTSLGAERDYREMTHYLLSGYADEAVASQAIAAMTLAMMYFFDAGKFNALLDVYENSESNRLRAKALTGVMLAMIPNADRIGEDMKIMSRLSLWNDSIETYGHLREVVKAIAGTRDTERVANKMKEEVLPELMKLRPEILKAMRERSLDPESIAENNPEWEELLTNSTLGDKMRELSEMQSDGADLMMVTFSNLKQFPFFNQAANWFLPFDPAHPDLRLTEEMRGMIAMMRKVGGMICDSDLYSLALAANQIPEAQMKMMSRQLSDNFEQLSEQAKAELDSAIAPAFNAEALRAVRDMYRFFKLFRRREGIFDPFAQPLHFLELPVVGEMLSENEVLRLFGEFYFKRGYYADALPLLEALVQENGDDATLWEKIGFCFQSGGEFLKALDAYEKASLLKTPGLWLTKKLAFINRCLGNYEAAAEHYQKALDMDPENVSLIMNTGNMLLETGDIPAALGQFYHAGYLRPDNPKVMRAIAWAELLGGNFEKSADYYARIIALEPQSSDYLNSGHAAFMLGRNREALNYYRLSAAQDAEAFEKEFLADIPQLAKFPDYDATAHRLLLDLTLM